MRSAGNFSPEWGYLAPAPSFMRTARVVLVATAVGATAGAAVVLSLIDRPAAEGEKTASVAHAIVTSVQAAPATVTPLATVAPLAAAAPAAATAATPSPATAVAPLPAPPQPTVAAPPVVVPSVAAAVRDQEENENIGRNDASVAAPQPDRPTAAPAFAEAPAATEAAHSDISEPIVAPEPPPKKTKHSATATTASANAKTKPSPTFGAVLKNLFSTHTATSNPNRGL